MLTSIAAITLTACAALAQTPAPRDTFTLWQLPQQSPTQMMSYVIQTVNDEVIVIDGGNEAEAGYLRGFLGALGDQVTLWIISHPHSDHVAALNVILDDPGTLQIDAIAAALPEVEWLKEHCPGETATVTHVERLRAGAERCGIPLRELTLGETFEIDGVHSKVLGVCNPEIHANGVNNSSMIWRMWDDRKSVLFTGDIGAEASEKVLNGPYRDELKADYLQMAHHGQAGATEAFYVAAAPRYCLWPTPDWLWDNDNGGGKGSGPWQTLEVRAWIDELDVERHYILKDGLHRID